jgi:hypothetical protein
MATITAPTVARLRRNPGLDFLLGAAGGGAEDRPNFIGGDRRGGRLRARLKAPLFPALEKMLRIGRVGVAGNDD